jgi:succinate-semialdehyde dehydrogenase/glutarate-semialdehyde dehydrogenase
MAIASVNPATGEVLRTFEALQDAAIDAAIARSERALRVNRARGFRERGIRMKQTAELLEKRQNELGRLITMEMGKPVKALPPRSRSAPTPAAITPSMPGIPTDST